MGPGDRSVKRLNLTQSRWLKGTERMLSVGQVRFEVGRSEGENRWRDKLTFSDKKGKTGGRPTPPNRHRHTCVHTYTHSPSSADFMSNNSLYKTVYIPPYSGKRHQRGTLWVHVISTSLRKTFRVLLGRNSRDRFYLSESTCSERVMRSSRVEVDNENLFGANWSSF